MIDVKEVLRRWSAGQSDRRIGREAGIDRKTVARYTDAATRLGLARDRELTDDEVHGVAQCVQSRPLRVIAVITEQQPVRRILAHLGLATEPPPVARARDPTEDAKADEASAQLALALAHPGQRRATRGAHGIAV
jgi:hypothetical protein